MAQFYLYFNKWTLKNKFLLFTCFILFTLIIYFLFTSYFFQLFTFSEVTSIFKAGAYTGIYKLLFGLLVLSLLTIWSFISIAGYFLMLYLTKYTNIEHKYPKLQKIVKYYQNMNIGLIVIETIFIIILHLIISVICIYFLIPVNTTL
uniref:G-protein coupled receptors family 1 profile domain-containing protein n=1 Tax=Schizopora paradoxa TaxID=27342 RepID=A0A5B9RCS8_9AGAM|nr:hypothetical protein Schpa_000050 [Schizopora paradoxa]QEG57233.1 hypothetical protein Schpa_000050 [Schizopora paradoxa]